MKAEVKEFIDKTIEFYYSSRKNKELMDRAVRQSRGLILFNLDMPRVLVEFPKNTLHPVYTNDLTKFLDRDIVDYIRDRDDYGTMIKVVTAHLFRVMSIGTTIDVELDIESLRVVRQYVYSRYRVKLRHIKIKNIIIDNADEILNMELPSKFTVPNYRMTDALISLYDDVWSSGEFSKSEFERLKRMMLLYISPRSNLYSSLRSDVDYGLLRLFMRVNHTYYKGDN